MSQAIQDILIAKTLAELAAPRKQQTSRVWTDPEGYQRLGAWQNSALLRVLIRVFTKGCLPRSEYRLKAQLDDVRIYKYALTSNQVKTLYNGGAAVKFGPLTGSP